jgi:hypothetical protein
MKLGNKISFNIEIRGIAQDSIKIQEFNGKEFQLFHGADHENQIFSQIWNHSKLTQASSFNIFATNTMADKGEEKSAGLELSWTSNKTFCSIVDQKLLLIYTLTQKHLNPM